jgi:superfamily II DNA or RNA helicase
LGTWIATLEPSFVEQRLGADTVTRALGSPRVYADGPVIDPAGRLAGSVVDTSAGRLTTPFRASVRMREDGLDVACACREPRLCAHVVGLLVDVAFSIEARRALAFGREVDAAELARARTRAYEERTLDERLALWAPSPEEVDLEIDLEVSRNANVPGAHVLLRHRVRGTRSLIGARDVLAMRARHRRLLDLVAPHHADRRALVATRGNASVLVHLLRETIGLRTEGFTYYVRYARDSVRPSIVQHEDRLVAEWGVAKASDALVITGPFPYLWVPAERTFHPIAPEVDLDAALGMQQVPSLPLGDAETNARIGRALIVRSRGVRVPPPEAFGLPSFDSPSFEIEVAGSPLDLVVELRAVYAAGRFVVGQKSEDLRDHAAEEAALARLALAGLHERDGLLTASEDDAVCFWESVATLRAEGFTILLSESLTRTRVGPPVTVDVRADGSAGWLDAELEFRAGSLGVELARLHRALADRRRFVVLDDGTIARIHDDLAELLGRIESARLPAHQIGRVEHDAEIGSPSVHVRLPKGEVLAASLPSTLHGSLRPYQEIALAWLQRLARFGAGALLADDMGLGKTLATIAFLARRYEDGETKPTLIVCPTSLVGHWGHEIERFAPAISQQVTITTYGMLRRNVTSLEQTHFACVVLDEAQNIKTPSSETARAARKLSAEMRVALSGTPIENRLSELWSILTFTNPGILGSLADFERRYHAVTPELRAIVRPFVLRRRKEDVLTELPPKIEVERACVLGLRQKRLYDALALAVRRSVADKESRRKDARTRLSVLTAILRLRQMACDPRLVDPSVPAADSAKRLAFLDLVRELVSEGRRALVFSQFTSLFDLWQSDLDAAHVPYERLDGSTTDRDGVVARFREGEAPLFLVSLKAGGAGLNLTAADTVVLCDPWWNPAAEDQAESRAHRLGQTRPVTVIRLVARGTIEDKIALLKRDKRELFGAMFGEALDDDDLTLLLGDADAASDDESENR